MVRIDCEALVAARPERVWELLVDHEGMTRWYPAAEVVRRRPGAPDPHGVGATRVVRVWGMAVEEIVTAFKAPERLEYSLVAGAPVRECRGEVVLTPVSESTRVHWSLVFRPALPGTGRPIGRMGERILRDALRGLARCARTD